MKYIFRLRLLIRDLSYKSKGDTSNYIIAITPERKKYNKRNEENIL